jgi:hypothetical protein
MCTYRIVPVPVQYVLCNDGLIRNNPNDDYHNIIVVDVAVELRILLGREHANDPSVVRTYFESDE